jgi:hypothetical protein
LLSDEDQAPPQVINGVGEERKRRGRPPKARPASDSVEEPEADPNSDGDDVI